MSIVYQLRSIVVYLWAIIVLVFCQPYMWYTNKLCQSNYEEGARKMNHFASRFAREICWLAGTKIEVKGLEHIPEDGSLLFVGNHQSMFDIPVMLAAVNRPIGFIAKQEMKDVPIFHKWIESIGSFYMPRGESRKSLEVILESSKFLKAHTHGLVIFPEGTRSEDGSLGDFKPGSLKIATRSNACIVPFALDNTRTIMPKGRFWMTPAKVKLTFFQAYQPEDIKGKETVVIMDEIKSLIAEANGVALTKDNDPTVTSGE